MAKNPNMTGPEIFVYAEPNLKYYAIVNPAATVTSFAATATATLAQLSKNWDNTGAAGTVTITLPAAKDARGKIVSIYLAVAQIVQLQPIATDRVYLVGSGVLNKYLQLAGVIGNYATIYSDGTNWYCLAYSGVITKAP